MEFSLPPVCLCVVIIKSPFSPPHYPRGYLGLAQYRVSIRKVLSRNLGHPPPALIKSAFSTDHIYAMEHSLCPRTLHNITPHWSKSSHTP